MYTWGDIKNITLMKLDLDESEGNTLSLISRFKAYANEAITIICSTVKPDRRFIAIEVTDDMVGTPVTINDSNFISFGDDINRIIYDEYGERVYRETHDDDFVYNGYNQIIPFRTGTFIISYNARWITFSTSDLGQDDNTQLNVPMDILECLPSYIASQCMKVDDDYKASVLRNEFEMMVARIDDTHYKTNKTFTIGGDW
jgi:hypothetical protein